MKKEAIRLLQHLLLEYHQAPLWGEFYFRTVPDIISQESFTFRDFHVILPLQDANSLINTAWPSIQLKHRSYEITVSCKTVTTHNQNLSDLFLVLLRQECCFPFCCWGLSNGLVLRIISSFYSLDEASEISSPDFLVYTKESQKWPLIWISDT